MRIVNATLILPDRLVAAGAIDVDNGRIAALGPQHELGRPSGPTFDAAGQIVGPGFVDVHVHGGDNADFMDATSDAFETVVRAHTRHGTTTIVPTSTVARHEQTLAFLQSTRDLKRRGPQPSLGPAGSPAPTSTAPTSTKKRSDATLRIPLVRRRPRSTASTSSSLM
jgi:N-acetylglucosamine-6-phosphate deacetylase